MSDCLAPAEASDAREDGEFESRRRGDEIPEWMADKQARPEKNREAKASLEAEAQAEEKARRGAGPRPRRKLRRTRCSATSPTSRAAS